MLALTWALPVSVLPIATLGLTSASSVIEIHPPLSRLVAEKVAVSFVINNCDPVAPSVYPCPVTYSIPGCSVSTTFKSATSTSPIFDIKTV